MIRPRQDLPRLRTGAAFTLIELVMAMAGAAVILAAIYGVFSRAVHLRDEATTRTREARVRTRALSILRNDLRNAYISGGVLASVLEGSANNPNGSYPGYLKFTATTEQDIGDDPSADVQQVEYYIVTDPAARGQNAGRLVRAITTDLLATVQNTPVEQPLLDGVQSLTLSFYDGQSWQNSWSFTTDNPTLPQAVKVDVQLAPASPNAPATAPLEVLVPWTTQASMSTTTN